MAMDTAHRRYVIRTVLFMAGYVAINMAAIRGAFDGRTAPGSWALGLAVTAPVVGQIWATLALIHDSDEFVGALTAKRFILAAGIAIAIASGWGFLELYAAAPHISAAMVYPLFWAAFGVVSPFVRTTR
jgi:hypothetical protein